MLAIQGLNQSTGSSDMLIRPELVLQNVETALPDIYYTLDGSDPRGENGNPQGQLFNTPFTLSESVQLRARTRVGDEWSALATGDFIVDGILGDINKNGVVDFADFLVLSGNFGKEVDSPDDGDLDDDGRVAFSDFLILSREFGNT